MAIDGSWPRSWRHKAVRFVWRLYRCWSYATLRVETRRRMSSYSVATAFVLVLYLL